MFRKVRRISFNRTYSTTSEALPETEISNIFQGSFHTNFPLMSESQSFLEYPLDSVIFCPLDLPHSSNFIDKGHMIPVEPLLVDSTNHLYNEDEECLEMSKMDNNETDAILDISMCNYPLPTLHTYIDPYFPIESKKSCIYFSGKHTSKVISPMHHIYLIARFNHTARGR